MIIQYESHELLGKSIFERVKFKLPFRPNVYYQNEACFIYSFNGKGVSYGVSDRSSIDPNESILMKCGTFVNSWESTIGNDLCEIIAIHITPNVLDLVFKDDLPEFLSNGKGEKPVDLLKIGNLTVIDEYIKGLVFYFDNPALMTKDLMILKLKEFILLLYHIDYPGIRSMLANLFSPPELNFRSIVLSHLYSDLNLLDFAALTNMSLSTFRRRFRLVFGTTPKKFIQDKKMERAALLLKASKLSVTEICFEIGFNDLSSFIRSFKKCYSKTPTEFRHSV